ncbi:MAG: FG-GAP repeat protein, partial [Myxococcota bacterium]
VVLAAGDFNGDQIDDLAVGDPGFDDGSGRVFVVFFNQAWIGEAGACGGDACAPWGERSVLGHHVILPEDVGLAAGEAHGFGAALAVADVTRKRKGSGELEQHQAEDLLIGAPGAFEYDPYEAGWAVDSLDTGTTSYGPELGSGDESFSQPQPQPRARVEEGGAVIMVRPNIMANLHDPAGASSLNWEVFDSRIVWNPGSFDAEFGAAIGRIPSFCDKAENESGVPLDGFAVGAPGEGSDAGAVYYYDCAVGQKGKWMTPLTTTGSHLHPTPMHRYGTSVMGFSITEMELPGCMTDHYIVAGAPRHPAAIGPMLSGRVYLHSVDDQGNTDLVTTLRPVSTVSGDDLFGAALAVHQEPSDQCFDEADEVVGGGHVEIAVGMPGNTVSGNDNAGRVYIWNPWNTDGSINHNSVIESPAPVLPETRFGQSIATVRNLTEGGGFVIGAPGGFGGFDLSKLPEEFKSITSGFIRTVLNQDFSTDFAWSSYPRVLTQATGAESPPTNLNTACGLGFEAAVIVPLLMLGRSLRARRSSRRGAGSGR